MKILFFLLSLVGSSFSQAASGPYVYNLAVAPQGDISYPPQGIGAYPEHVDYVSLQFGVNGYYAALQITSPYVNDTQTYSNIYIGQGAAGVDPLTMALLTSINHPRSIQLTCTTPATQVIVKDAAGLTGINNFYYVGTGSPCTITKLESVPNMQSLAAYAQPQDNSTIGSSGYELNPGNTVDPIVNAASASIGIEPLSSTLNIFYISYQHQIPGSATLTTEVVKFTYAIGNGDPSLLTLLNSPLPWVEFIIECTKPQPQFVSGNSVTNVYNSGLGQACGLHTGMTYIR